MDIKNEERKYVLCGKDIGNKYGYIKLEFHLEIVLENRQCSHTKFLMQSSPVSSSTPWYKTVLTDFRFQSEEIDILHCFRRWKLLENQGYRNILKKIESPLLYDSML